MNQNFVNKDQAERLELMGFDEPCFGGYLKDKFNYFTDFIHYPASGANVTHNPRTYGKKSHVNKHITKAPLIQQAFKWFRDKYDITYSIIWKIPRDGNGYKAEIQNGREFFDIGLYVNYEEAEFKCLEKLIEMIKPDTIQ